MSSVHRVDVANYDDALLRLIDLASNDNAASVAVVAGGTGYVVGDILDVLGGTAVSSLVTRLEVTSVAVGVIDGIRVLDCGAYTVQPTNPVSVTGGAGTTATFNLTFEVNNWLVNRNDVSSSSLLNYPGIQGGGGTQILGREVQLQGVGNAGTDEIYVGILEIEDPGTGSFNWTLAGFTGFNGLVNWEDQPGFSYSSPKEVAAFTPLTDGVMECWLYVSPRVLTGVMRIGSTYNNFTLGFLNPFASPSDFPYPLYISGCSSKWNENFSTSGVRQSGLCDPGSYNGTGGNGRGPAGIRLTDGEWYYVNNWNFTGSSRSRQVLRAVYPCQSVDPDDTFISPADEVANGNDDLSWKSIIPSGGNPGTQDINLFPSYNPAGNETLLIPTMVFATNPSLQILGEISDVFWGSTTGNNIVSQDRVVVGGVYYRAFQNCNRSDQFSFVFIREDA